MHRQASLTGCLPAGAATRCPDLLKITLRAYARPLMSYMATPDEVRSRAYVRAVRIVTPSSIPPTGWVRLGNLTEAIELLLASLGEVPHVDTSRTSTRDESELTDATTSSTHLPGVGAEELRKVCVADPCPAVDLGEKPSRQ